MNRVAVADTALSAGIAPDRVETHVSVLTFYPDIVRKRKKAVRFPFIDLSTPALRLAACRHEFDLNRRLAPDVYLDVEEMRDDAGNLIDAEVIMRRLADDRRLATLIASGADVTEELTRIAHILAAFHSTALRGAAIDSVATPAGLLNRWDADLDEWEPLAHEVLGIPSLARQRSLIRRYIAGRADLLTQRIEGGHIVDGHGDLLAEDIFCLPDGPRILDCLEFDPLLRYGDDLADVAFLAMDLETMGRPELAEFFARTYQRLAGEHFPASLLHVYIAQRAMVRSKVACLRAAQGDAGAVADARKHLNVCFRHLEFARPVLIVIGGAPGTGKSTLATRLADAMGWVHLRSDEVRRDVAHVTHGPRDQDDSLDAGLYAPNITARTYATLLAEASALLRKGVSVILDATFSTAITRRAARHIGDESSADVVELECDAPLGVVRGRVVDRHQRGDDVSEVTPGVAYMLQRRRDTWPQAHRIDTTMSEAAQLVRCLRHVGETPVGKDAV